MRFEITLRHITLGRTPLDELSAHCRDLYLTAHNTHERKTSMPPARFEPAIPANERPLTHALDRTATGIGTAVAYINTKSSIVFVIEMDFVHHEVGTDP